MNKCRTCLQSKILGNNQLWDVWLIINEPYLTSTYFSFVADFSFELLYCIFLVDRWTKLLFLSTQVELESWSPLSENSRIDSRSFRKYLIYRLCVRETRVSAVIYSNLLWHHSLHMPMTKWYWIKLLKMAWTMA